MHQWRWTLLRAGSFRLDGGTMFGIIPKALWAKAMPPDAANRITLQTNCLLLDDGSRKVLVEAGYGNKFDARNRAMYEMEDRWVADALRERGLEPADISAVVVTHLHFDHAGGLTHHFPGSITPVPTFPNAKIHVQRTEWEDALANKSTMTRTYLRDHLDPIADRVVLLDGEGEALPGIRVTPTPGHTWGQQGVIFHDGRGTVIFPGDVMPTFHHAGLAYNMAYDVLPYRNMQTKRSLLERCEGEGWRIAIDHEPGLHAVVEVARDPKRPDAFTLRPVVDHGATGG